MTWSFMRKLLQDPERLGISRSVSVQPPLQFQRTWKTLYSLLSRDEDMSNPVRKRKRGDPGDPPRTFRSIDSFFKSPRKQPHEADCRIPKSPSEHQLLTDEELARKLQAEWDNDASSNFRNATPTNSDENQAPPSQDMKASDGQHPIPAPPKPCIFASSKKKKSVLSLQTSTSAEDTISMSLPLDQPPLTFNPSLYLDKLREFWNTEGGHASYSILARAFSLVNSTQSRIRIVDILVNLLRILIEGDPDSLLPAVWLATNAFAPPYVPLELGLGGSAISKALKKAYGLDNLGLKTLYDKYGDAGDVAYEAKKKQSFTLRRPKPLSIKGVYDSLMKIANSKGTGSQENKQRLVEQLLRDARGAEESRYIVRTLVQHLRIGAVRTTMLIALARAFLYSRPPSASYRVRTNADLMKLKRDELASLYAKAEEMIKASYARHPNYNDLIPCLLATGISEAVLAKCGLALHVPLLPMLGSITRDLTEMLTKLQGRKFSCEYKYDGQRAQVHCDSSGKVSLFSRHLELMTDKYPDLVSLVPQIRGDGVSSFVLEGEVVAVDQESGVLLPFQTLSNRAKKNVEIGDIKINVCLFAFDLMYLNGEALLERPFRERRELLRSLFVEIPNRFSWVKSIDATSSESETILNFFQEATNAKCEGIMVKVLDDGTDGEAPGILTSEESSNISGEKQKGSRRRTLLSTYEPDKRLDSWLKVKKDYNAAFDTLDLIPIAGWHGQGRKAQWWSPILLAVRNPETGSLEAVTKCMSGFTDKFYQENKEKYAENSNNTIPRPSYVEYRNEPEVWFEPQEVWEIAFADITLSPTYTAAIGMASEERGLSLRFPRFLRVREDKTIEDASTSSTLAELWKKQMARLQSEGADLPQEEENG
ncbi:ATP-dependent DNA ligase, putative [Coccidioides posadasii C735 delta SOWgp]|uniref:DNA ligase n=1 Tax=Coccidioides posadasii (strain C735) TaxID=222929 RepID=C5P9C8_COCP7|nr:ATP-dependent DNA ligase, putative [Coccidioides posadasii C735 delta SOWgp]EER26340.1 ATP-dependent DNA ligase, putative [Coccidioides posadasii C735 delta SOWgp]|eukprot:XP_003068485.1 ATP-dependent DNA ligase, putative [Coccidioides posadasii C735 delta SOWgp]